MVGFWWVIYFFNNQNFNNFPYKTLNDCQQQKIKIEKFIIQQQQIHLAQSSAIKMQPQKEPNTHIHQNKSTNHIREHRNQNNREYQKQRPPQERPQQQRGNWVTRIWRRCLEGVGGNCGCLTRCFKKQQKQDFKEDQLKGRVDQLVDQQFSIHLKLSKMEQVQHPQLNSSINPISNIPSNQLSSSSMQQDFFPHNLQRQLNPNNSNNAKLIPKCQLKSGQYKEKSVKNKSDSQQSNSMRPANKCIQQQPSEKKVDHQRHFFNQLWNSSQIQNFFGKFKPQSQVLSHKRSSQSNIKIQDYTVINYLGRGTQSENLFLVQSSNKQMYALKLIRSNQANQLNSRMQETRMYLKLDHPNILKMRESFFCKQKTQLAMVLEYCPDGDLRKFIGKINYSQCRKIMIQITEGLVYLHQRKISHINISTSNILMKDGNAKLNFFLHTKTRHDTTLPEDTRYLYYTAQQCILGERYGLSADIWSLGIVFLELLSGKLLSDSMLLGHRICCLIQGFPSAQLINLIESSKDRELVRIMLQRDPEKRPGAKEVLGILNGSGQEKEINNSSKKPKKIVNLFEKDIRNSSLINFQDSNHHNLLSNEFPNQLESHEKFQMKERPIKDDSEHRQCPKKENSSSTKKKYSQQQTGESSNNNNKNNPIKKPHKDNEDQKQRGNQKQKQRKKQKYYSNHRCTCNRGMCQINKCLCYSGRGYCTINCNCVCSNQIGTLKRGRPRSSIRVTIDPKAQLHKRLGKNESESFQNNLDFQLPFKKQQCLNQQMLKNPQQLFSFDEVNFQIQTDDKLHEMNEIMSDQLEKDKERGNINEILQHDFKENNDIQIQNRSKGSENHSVNNNNEINSILEKSSDEYQREMKQQAFGNLRHPQTDDSPQEQSNTQFSIIKSFEKDIIEAQCPRKKQKGKSTKKQIQTQKMQEQNKFNPVEKPDQKSNKINKEKGPKKSSQTTPKTKDSQSKIRSDKRLDQIQGIQQRNLIPEDNQAFIKTLF